MDEAGIDNREEYPYGYCSIGQRFYALKSGKRTRAGQLDCGPQAGAALGTDDL
ncbi:Mobile element protein [uncultured Leptolyngbya sp.]|uniref:Mobile element protein n=1 Tax=uncultured Leptolyngbya sp. TaxID=332963 RepID=A0A6J4PFI4_9CYAN|nr:Mobile element protein [uncultured Leptolyngbya sp.]